MLVNFEWKFFKWSRSWQTKHFLFQYFRFHETNIFVGDVCEWCQKIINDSFLSKVCRTKNFLVRKTSFLTKSTFPLHHFRTFPKQASWSSFQLANQKPTKKLEQLNNHAASVLFRVTCSTLSDWSFIRSHASRWKPQIDSQLLNWIHKQS